MRLCRWNFGIITCFCWWTGTFGCRGVSEFGSQAFSAMSYFQPPDLLMYLEHGLREILG